MTWLSLLLAALAVYRLAYLVAVEDGPFDVASRVRARVGQATWIGRGVHCPLCVGFWLALAAALWLGVAWTDLPLAWLGIAGGAALVQKMGRY